MANPLLAMLLLIVMAGAWVWVLWPAAPTGAVTPATAIVPATAVSVPSVHLERLGSGAPGVDWGRGADPFRRRSSPRGGPAAAPVTVVPVTLPDATLAAPQGWPRLELIGVAEAQEGGRSVRTAIVSGPTGVLHARAGDVLEQVYRVERVAPDGTEVRLLPEDRVVRLALRP